MSNHTGGDFEGARCGGRRTSSATAATLSVRALQSRIQHVSLSAHPKNWQCIHPTGPPSLSCVFLNTAVCMTLQIIHSIAGLQINLYSTLPRIAIVACILYLGILGALHHPVVRPT